VGEVPAGRVFSPDSSFLAFEVSFSNDADDGGQPVQLELGFTTKVQLASWRPGASRVALAVLRPQRNPPLWSSGSTAPNHNPVCVASWRQQPGAGRTWSKETGMSVYRVTEIIGTSSTSWEDAASEAIKTAAGTLRDLRVAEVVKQDISLDEDGAITYRTKLQLSFKYEPGN
jgi:flavin-binding protein dodecin